MEKFERIWERRAILMRQFHGGLHMPLAKRKTITSNTNININNKSHKSYLQMVLLSRYNTYSVGRVKEVDIITLFFWDEAAI
jgi:hypothetical protein